MIAKQKNKMNVIAKQKKQNEGARQKGESRRGVGRLLVGEGVFCKGNFYLFPKAEGKGTLLHFL